MRNRFKKSVAFRREPYKANQKKNMSILNWIEDKKRLKLLNAPKHVATSADSSKGLWTRCDKCGIILYIKHLKENQRVCFGCSYHLQMMSGERIENLLDKLPTTSLSPRKKSTSGVAKEGVGESGNNSTLVSKTRVSTWRPLDETVSPCDPLRFHDQKRYRDRLQDAQERTGLQDAIQTGTGMIDGIPVALAVMDFSFMGGSMGSVVGEKITRLIEYATGEGLTLLIVSASGGARMQEGVFSLMQMAKISSALRVYQSCARLLYISIVTSPTTGGVTASFAMLGDIIFAEPKALIAFAGRRVIEQTLSEDLPDDFQTSEYMLHHGLVDLIVPRRFLRQAVSESIRLYQNAPFKKRGQLPFGVQNPINFLTEEKIRRSWGVLTKLDKNSEVGSDRPSFCSAYSSHKTESGVSRRAKHDFTPPKVIGQRESSSRFGGYREILTSFESMLHLFLSGNMKKEDSGSKLAQKAALSPLLPRARHPFDADPYKTTIFNHSGDFLESGKDAIGFWLYNGMILRKQDLGKKRLEQARYSCSTKLRIQVQGNAYTSHGSHKTKLRVLDRNQVPGITKQRFGEAKSFGLSRALPRIARSPENQPLVEREVRLSEPYDLRRTRGMQKRVTNRSEQSNNGSKALHDKTSFDLENKTDTNALPLTFFPEGDEHVRASKKFFALPQKGVYQRLSGDLYLAFLLGNLENHSRVWRDRNGTSASYKAVARGTEGECTPVPAFKTGMRLATWKVRTSLVEGPYSESNGSKMKDKTASIYKNKKPFSKHLAQKRERVLRNKRSLEEGYNLSYKALFYICAKNADSIFSVFKKENRSLLYKKFLTFMKLSYGVKQIENSFLMKRNPLRMVFSQEGVGVTVTANGKSVNTLSKEKLSSVTPRTCLATQRVKTARSQRAIASTQTASSLFCNGAKTLQVAKQVGVAKVTREDSWVRHQEIDKPSLLHDFRVVSTFTPQGSLKFVRAVPLAQLRFVKGTHDKQEDVQTKKTSKGDSWGNRSAVGLKQTDYLSERALSRLQDKDKFYSFAQGGTWYKSTSFTPGTCLATRRIGSVQTLSIVPQKGEFDKQNGKFTTKKADINFLNQAIELAATEGVEWRAFYMYQQLSENMDFLEDFLQQDPKSRKQNGNVLFYKSICRSEKAFGGLKTR